MDFYQIYNFGKDMRAWLDECIPKKEESYINLVEVDNGAISEDLYYKIQDIKKIIQNDKVTIIITKNGDKTIVKCQDDNTFDPIIGLCMCLLRYLVSPKLYTELQSEIFDIKVPESNIPQSESMNLFLRMLCELSCVTLIGRNIYDEIYIKFYEGLFDKDDISNNVKLKISWESCNE